MNKKILIATGIFPPDTGGPATYAKLLADHWSNGVIVVTYTRALRRIPKPFRHVIYFFNVWRQAKKTDLIYSLSATSAGLPAALAARLRKKPFLVRIAGDSVWESAINRKQTSLLINDFQTAHKSGRLALRHRMQVWVCRQARSVVVPSEYLAGIVEGWGISSENIRVVHNAIHRVALAEQGKDILRKELGIPGALIVSPGRLVPWKGFRMLIKLMPQFLEINPFFRLVIVGDGPELGMLKHMAKNLNLTSKIIFTGKQSDEQTNRYLAAADLYILNTGYEGFSHATLAAMTYGVPVITTNVGGNRELIHQGENGFMVKYNDEFNILEAVKTLWQSPELRKKFSEAGRMTASRYTPERTIEETETVIYELF